MARNEQTRHEVAREYGEAYEALRYAEQQKASAERAPQQYRAMGGRIWEANREYCEAQIAYWTQRYEEAQQRWLVASEAYHKATADTTEETTEVSEATTEADTTTTEATTEATAEQTEMQRALVGANICEAHWEHKEELELAREARERKARLVAGTATEEDMLGALDWADCRDKAEQIVADRDPHHTVAGRYAEMALDGWHEDEMADRLARTYEEWGCEISEAYRLANAHLTEELGEGWNR